MSINIVVNKNGHTGTIVSVDGAFNYKIVGGNGLDTIFDEILTAEEVKTHLDNYLGDTYWPIDYRIDRVKRNRNK